MEHKILSGINSPNDIKMMTTNEIELLAKDIRKFLVRSISQTGGHLASNLGIVELTLALHKVFNSPKDKIDSVSDVIAVLINEEEPMLVTLFGISIDVKSVQLLNA